jgi:HEPN domain-containing protein
MDTESKIRYWVELSLYDLETARAMLKTERFLYVGFMAHQSIEKALKALIWKKAEKEPPYSHDLWKLANEAGLGPLMEPGMADLLDDLSPLNIEARYPKAKDRLLASLTKEICVTLLDRTERMLGWIQAQL